MSLTRTLKRKPSYHSFQHEDLRWLYAAHKQGADFGFDASVDEFSERMVERLWTFEEAWILEAGKPVGVVGGGINDHRMELHVIWFPWATVRQKLEAAVNFINDFRKDFLLLIYTESENKVFFEHICKHGILTRVGTIPDFFDFSTGEAAKMYRSLKK